MPLRGDGVEKYMEHKWGLEKQSKLTGVGSKIFLKQRRTTVVHAINIRETLNDKKSELRRDCT